MQKHEYESAPRGYNPHARTVVFRFCIREYSGIFHEATIRCCVRPPLAFTRTHGGFSVALPQTVTAVLLWKRNLPFRLTVSTVRPVRVPDGMSKIRLCYQQNGSIIPYGPFQAQAQRRKKLSKIFRNEFSFNGCQLANRP